MAKMLLFISYLSFSVEDNVEAVNCILVCINVQEISFDIRSIVHAPHPCLLVSVILFPKFAVSSLSNFFPRVSLISQNKIYITQSGIEFHSIVERGGSF
jgi:hypothetical protein